MLVMGSGVIEVKCLDHPPPPKKKKKGDVIERHLHQTTPSTARKKNPRACGTCSRRSDGGKEALDGATPNRFFAQFRWNRLVSCKMLIFVHSFI